MTCATGRQVASEDAYLQFFTPGYDNTTWSQTREQAYDQTFDSNGSTRPCSLSLVTLYTAINAVFQGVFSIAQLSTPITTIIKARARPPAPLRRRPPPPAAPVPLVHQRSGRPLPRLDQASRACNDVLATVARVPPIDAFSDAGEKLPSVKGEVEMRDVVFAYPSAPDFNICNGYSLTIPAGSSCALVGPSGSGKSTIVALLERFYDPKEGALFLDGFAAG